jgi:hypothetical protein
VSLGGVVGSCSTLLDWAKGTFRRRTAAAACQTTLAGAGGAQVWTVNATGTQNPPQGHRFDGLTVSCSTPTRGATALTDITADGTSTVIDQYDGDSGSQCVDPAMVIGPVGQKCIRLDCTPVQGGVSGATRSVRTCWLDVPRVLGQCRAAHDEPSAYHKCGGSLQACAF